MANKFDIPTTSTEMQLTEAPIEQIEPFPNSVDNDNDGDDVILVSTTPATNTLESHINAARYQDDYRSQYIHSGDYKMLFG